MLEALLERARGSRGVRLLQDGFNMHSFALYARLGFEAQELFVLLEGSPDKPAAAEWEVRSMTPADVPACESLHDQVHGFTRTNELRDLLSAGSPVVAVREGAIRAYLTEPAVWFVNHAVAHSDEDMEALLLGTRAFSSGPLSFLMPVRRAALLRLCLAQRFQTVRPMMLMTMGEYREPNGTYFP